MDVFYTSDGIVIHQGSISTIGTPFAMPRIGEKIVLKGDRWLVQDVVWDLDENQVEFVITDL